MTRVNFNDQGFPLCHFSFSAKLKDKAVPVKKGRQLGMAGEDRSQALHFPASSGKRAFKCQYSHP